MITGYVAIPLALKISYFYTMYFDHIHPLEPPPTAPGALTCFPLYFISFLFARIILFLLSYMSVCVRAYVCTVCLLRPKEVWGGMSGPLELEL